MNRNIKNNSDYVWNEIEVWLENELKIWNRFELREHIWDLMGWIFVFEVIRWLENGSAKKMKLEQGVWNFYV